MFAAKRISWGCQDRIKMSMQLVRERIYSINAPTKKDERIASVDNIHVKRGVSDLAEVL